MAGSSSGIYNQMQDVEKMLSGYNLGQSPETIRAQVLGRVNNLRPQFDELAQAQNAAYALPGQVMQQFNQNQNAGQYIPQGSGITGTQFTGIDPLARMTSALGSVGQQFGRADALSNGIDFQKGRLEDIIKTIGNQYQLSYQQGLDRYNRLLPLYQSALQMEEAARARRAMSGGGGGYNFGMDGGGGGGNPNAVDPNGNPDNSIAPWLETMRGASPEQKLAFFNKRYQGTLSPAQQVQLMSNFQRSAAQPNLVKDWRWDLGNASRNPLRAIVNMGTNNGYDKFVNAFNPSGSFMGKTIGNTLFGRRP